MNTDTCLIRVDPCLSVSHFSYAPRHERTKSNSILPDMVMANLASAPSDDEDKMRVVVFENHR